MSAQSITFDMIDDIVANTDVFKESEQIKYTFDEDSQTITVYSIKTIDSEECNLDYPYYIDTYVRVRIENNGLLRLIDNVEQAYISIDEVRSIINRRLWLYKVDQFDNTSILDYSKTPIKDNNAIDWYPLLDEFATIDKMQDYLKSILTDNLAENYIKNTSIRVFGNELYDIGGKVSQYSYYYEDFLMSETYVSKNGNWHLYTVTIPDPEGLGECDIFHIGLLLTPEGWRIAYSSIKEGNETDYLQKYEKSTVIEQNNPSTSDYTLIFPLLLTVSIFLFIHEIKNLIIKNN